MAACGDRYREVFKTGTGRTWDDPWLGYAGITDWFAWRKISENATDKMWQALERLGEVEGELGRGYPKYNEYNGQSVAIYNARNALPHALVGEPQIYAPQAVQITRDAACMLEQVEDALAGYGKKPTTVPGSGAPPSFLDKSMPYVVVAALVAGAWYLDKSDTSSEEEGG
jgi:hypothetical protein